MLDRTIDRRGLYDIDGNVLPDHVIGAVQYGSIVDRDVCHLSIRDMVQNLCHSNIMRMVREFDLENNIWFTDPYSECGRYADDILYDWEINGSPTYTSLYDVVSAYADMILSCGKPHRVFDHNTEFIFTHKYGLIPKTLCDPLRPKPYQIGEGHGTIPDGVDHPLLKHMVNCVPPNLTPHNKSDCSQKITFMPFQQKREVSTHMPKNSTHDEKKGAILDMIRGLEPDAAYVLERNGRHDILMCGNTSASEAFKQSDAIQTRFKTPVGCLVLNSDMLLQDQGGNDAKSIVMNGVSVRGTLRVSGPVEPPRPAAMTSGKIIWNADRNGFPVGIHDMPNPAPYIRPEYIITASQFTNEARLYISGMAVLICQPNINWDLMAYLARTYQFAGTLLGILDGLAENGHVFRYPYSILHAYKPVQIPVDFREILRVYSPPRPDA